MDPVPPQLLHKSVDDMLAGVVLEGNSSGLTFDLTGLPKASPVEGRVRPRYRFARRLAQQVEEVRATSFHTFLLQVGRSR